MFWFLASFIIWALVHSLTAASSTKSAFRKQFGERAYQGLYRLLYNVLSLVSFVPVLYALWTQIPQVTLWTIPYPWRYITMGIQLLALGGLTLSLWQTDVWSFAGLRQALWHRYSLISWPHYTFGLAQFTKNAACFVPLAPLTKRTNNPSPASSPAQWQSQWQSQSQSQSQSGSGFFNSDKSSTYSRPAA
jgi:hypothetical protein